MKPSKITRRKFVGGAAVLAATGVTTSLFAARSARAASSTIGKETLSSNTQDLFKYHCSLVHKEMSDKLTRIVADPKISAKQTAQALRTTFCPCCNTQINASYPIVPWEEIGKAYG